VERGTTILIHWPEYYKKKISMKLFWLSMSLHIVWKIARRHPWKIYEEKALQKTEEASQTTTSRRDMFQNLQRLENI